MQQIFSFTKEDTDLIKGQSKRDPLGTQVIWSAMGRHIVPHLTEQTNSVLGFQLLLSIFYFYDKYLPRVDSKFNEIKGMLNKKNARHTFSLENIFILLEQAFAFSYYMVKNDWPLNGKLQVIAFHENPHLSLERQILSSQLSTGVWGYYRGTAIRAGIIDDIGRHLSESLTKELENDDLHQSLIRKKCFDLITGALIENGVDFPHYPSNYIVKIFSEILISLPQKKSLRTYLMTPFDNNLVKSLAEFCIKHKLYDQDDDYWRKFILLCQNEFSSYKEHFKNIIRCTDYIGSLDWIFEWLMYYNNESISDIAAALPIKIQKIRDAKLEFAQTSTFSQSVASFRAKLYLSDINLESATTLIADLISIHGKIAESRGSLKWARLSDTGKIIVDLKPNGKQEDIPTISPGKGWRYDYYLTPLMNIYRGLR